jgi:hypothetical protein
VIYVVGELFVLVVVDVLAVLVLGCVATGHVCVSSVVLLVFVARVDLLLASCISTVMRSCCVSDIDVLLVCVRASSRFTFGRVPGLAGVRPLSGGLDCAQVEFELLLGLQLGLDCGDEWAGRVFGVPGWVGEPVVQLERVRRDV